MIHTIVSKSDNEKDMYVDVIIKGDFPQVLEEYKATGRAIVSSILSDAPDPIVAISDMAEALNIIAQEMVKNAKDIIEEDKNA